MTVSLNAVGTIAAGTTSVTPTNPSHAADDILVATIWSKPTLTATPPTVNTPGGWTPIANASDGSGTLQGTDAGEVWVNTYYIVAVNGSTTNPAFTVTNGNVCMAVVNTWRKTVAGSWSVQGVVAGDTSSATSWQTDHASLNLAPGDGINYGAAASGNGTNSNIFPATATLAATGHTFSAQTITGPSNTNNGTDMAAVGYNWLVSTGTSSSVTGSVTATLLSAQKGVAALVRVREPATVQATLSAPLGGLTASMTATVSTPVQAVLTAPLGDLTATATATVDHPATLAAPLGSLAATATATVEHPATLSAPLGSLAAAATATVDHPATLTAPLGGLSAAATATVDHPAVLDAPLGGLTATATATVEHPATLAAPLGGLTASMTATVETGGSTTHEAVLAAPLGGLTATATATVEHPATLAAALGSLTASATATVTHHAVLTAPLGALVAGIIIPIPDPNPIEGTFQEPAPTTHRSVPLLAIQETGSRVHREPSSTAYRES